MVFKGDPDDAYTAWTHMTATDWRHLLVDGGIMDQPEVLWADVMSIEFMHRRVKESQDDKQ